MLERVKELEHEGYHFEAADGSFELLLRKETGDYEPLFRLESWRVIVEKRADGRVETEATIKLWVDGERYVRTAEGNGPVNALDKALRDALVEIYPELDDDRARSTSRSGSSTRPRAPTRSPACCSTPPTASTSGARSASPTNVIEASWEALVDSLEYGMQVGRPPRGRADAARTRRDARRRTWSPAQRGRTRRSRWRGRCSASARRSWCSRCCAPASCRSGPRRRSSSGRSPRRSARAYASAVSSGTAGLHLALRAVGVSDGDEVITTPFSFVASANVAIYERARPVFADIDPVTLNLDPDAAAAAVTARTAAILPVHVFGYPADMAALETRWTADRRGRLRGARRHLRRRRHDRRPRPPGGVRVLREQADDHRRGRDGRHRRRGA